jgi:hypothetical protein
MGLFDGKLIEFEDARIVARSGEITVEEMRDRVVTNASRPTV